MNRAARRQAERLVSRMKRRAATDPNAVTLRGGPMDGWVVKPGADALQPDWRAQYLLEEARAAFEETRRRGMAQGVPLDELPTWEGITDAKRAEYVAMVARAKGAGRYVMVSESPREARWESA